MSKPLPKQTARWDERRNSSQVTPPPPDALPNALRALRHFRETQPELAAWIAEGHPHLTETDHLERFGQPYQKHRNHGSRLT